MLGVVTKATIQCVPAFDLHARETIEVLDDLLDNFAGLYARCDDLTRRLCNQALFTKVYVEDDLTLRPEHTRPFELLLDPEVQASALTWAKTAKSSGQKCSEAQTPADSSSAEGLSLVRVVGPEGLEPPTSAV